MQPTASPLPPDGRGEWLYVTRKLELLTLPSSPLLGPTLTLGEVTYYRCTPAVLRWLLAAGVALNAKRPDPEQARAYLDGVERVRAFVEAAYSKEHVEAELAKPGTPALPDVGRVPDW